MSLPPRALFLTLTLATTGFAAFSSPARAQGPAIELAPGDEGESAEPPIQSPVILPDQPAPALKKYGAMALPRQSQVDVALDARMRKLRGPAIGGYGEATLNAPFGPGAGPAIADLRRTILFFGFNFTDRIRFFSEIEFEHVITSDGKKGEVAVEQAFLDFLLSRFINLRAGMTIIPINLVNLYHEPSTFNGVDRPDVDLFIVPSTWKQLVAVLFGAIGPVRYQLYVTPGLRAEGFNADVGIRGGVQDNLAIGRDWGIVGRADYAPLLGMNLGLSGYWARAGQGDPNLGNVPVSIGAFDAKFGRFGISLRAQVSYVHIGDIEQLNHALILARPGNAPVSRQLVGGYIEAGYNLLYPVARAGGMQLILFGRYERTDTQLDVPGNVGLLRKPGNDRTVYTLGLTYRPIFEIAVKLDYQRRHTEVLGSATNQINAAIAYQF
jgi:hypothetical protein